MDGHGDHIHGGGAQRRRERRLRAFHRHERLALAMQMATVSLHSWHRQGRDDAGTQTEPNAAPAPVGEYIAPTRVVDNITPDPAENAAPVTESMAFALVIEYVAPAPVLSDFLEPTVPVVQVAQVLHLQLFEKTVVIPEIQSGQGAQTAECLETAPLRHVTFAETVEVREVGSVLPAVSAPAMHVTTPVVDTPPCVVEHAQPDPVIEFADPASAMTYAEHAPVDEYSAPP